MTEPDPKTTVREAAQALGITQLIPTIYEDLLQPAAKETGQQLILVARAVGMALAPLNIAVWGYDRISDYLKAAIAARLATKPAELIQPPDPIIAGPAILNMTFAADAPHLREMYATLLAHAMHKPSAPKVHPSFAQVIQQLSPAEAQILKEIAALHETEAVLFQEVVLGGSGGGVNTGGPYISTQWHEFCSKCCGIAEGVADVSYDNLIRLGLLTERSEAESRHGKTMGGGDRIALETVNFVMLTSYGSHFLEVCVRDV